MDLNLYRLALMTAIAALILAIVAIIGARRWKRHGTGLIALGIISLLVAAMCIIAAVVMDPSLGGMNAQPQVRMRH